MSSTHSLSTTNTASVSTRTKLWLAAAALGLVALGATAAYTVSQWRSEPAPASTMDLRNSTSATPATPAARAPARPVAAAPRCENCGVVESVTAIRQKGEGTGLGAAAGGVVGGVIGHQMGGGSGKDAMTVIGAIGGGVAGHEIEKRQRATTTYRVQVRMSDGSLRTVTQPQAPSVGQKVKVDGQQLRVTG